MLPSLLPAPAGLDLGLFLLCEMCTRDEESLLETKLGKSDGFLATEFLGQNFSDSYDMKQCKLLLGGTLKPLMVTQTSSE